MFIIDRLLLTKRIIRDLHIQRYTQTPPPPPTPTHTCTYTYTHGGTDPHQEINREWIFEHQTKYKTNSSLSKMPLQSTNITIMILKLTPHMHANYTPMSDTPKIHITQHTRRGILFHREQNSQGPSFEGTFHCANDYRNYNINSRSLDQQDISHVKI